MTTDFYLDSIGDWVDPNPAPVIEKHNEFIIVRDDLLGYGSKIRFIDYLIKNDDGNEWVFGGANKVGWGPIALTQVCNRYGKKATFFVSKGPALDMRTNQLTTILVDGKLVPTTNFQEQLYLKYRQKYKAE